MLVSWLDSFRPRRVRVSFPVKPQAEMRLHPLSKALPAQTQFLLSFAQGREVDDLIQGNISSQLEFGFGLIDDEGQPLGRNISIRAENLPGAIVGSRRMLALHLAPLHQDAHGTLFVLADEAVCP